MRGFFYGLAEVQGFAGGEWRSTAQHPRAGSEASLLAAFAAALVVILNGPKGVGTVLTPRG